MAFIDHLDRLNRYQADGYLALLVDERPVGALRPAFADALRHWPVLFEHRDDTVALRTGSGDITQRSEPLGALVCFSESPDDASCRGRDGEVRQEVSA